MPSSELFKKYWLALVFVVLYILAITLYQLLRPVPTIQVHGTWTVVTVIVVPAAPTPSIDVHHQ